MAEKNRIFKCFAIEDSWARDFLVGQARNEDSPFEFVDMSVKEPWDTRCRTKIRSCDGVIAMISWNTLQADGALWEMECANDEGIPLIGVYIDSDDPPRIPDPLSSKEVIEWTWPGIADFIDSLP